MYNIRLFKPEDYEEVVSFWIEAGLVLSYSDREEELAILAEANPDSFKILEHGNEIIGTVIGTFDGRRGYIQHVAIHPQYQGQGLGKMLMNDITNYFTEKGVVKIHLMIERENIDVVNFYKNIGWYIRDDLILMSKTLRSGEFSS